jgi:paraquat-inducible protein A
MPQFWRWKSVPEKLPSFSPLRRTVLVLLALAYVVGAGLSTWKIIAHTKASTDAIEKILLLYNMKNEGAMTLGSYEKEHPLLGFLFGDPVKQELKLPSQGEAANALYTEAGQRMKTVRLESSIAAWWSWFLVSLSVFYVVTVVAVVRSFNDRPVFFALTTISVTCFITGIFAPAMVIWTAPIIPLQSGDLSFVVQHQVRGIAAIIWELLTGGHSIIGGFLLLFSIVTPLTKISLTYFVTFSRSHAINFKIGEVLHTIGKWSMADVFVAAVLLALYALKFQQATKSIPCLGLYYFIGYCLLSLSTTQLLVYSGLVDEKREKSKRKLGLNVIGGLLAAAICFAAASSAYTYQQYTMNTHEKVRELGSPTQLNNADLVLPVHKK